MTSLHSMSRRLDRIAVSSQEPTVAVAVCPPGLSSVERGRLRELVGLTRRSAAESAELDGLLQRAPEVAAALDGSRCAVLLYMSEREMRLKATRSGILPRGRILQVAAWGGGKAAVAGNPPPARLPVKQR